MFAQGTDEYVGICSWRLDIIQSTQQFYTPCPGHHQDTITIHYSNLFLTRQGIVKSSIYCLCILWLFFSNIWLFLVHKALGLPTNQYGCVSLSVSSCLRTICAWLSVEQISCGGRSSVGILIDAQGLLSSVKAKPMLFPRKSSSLSL